MDSAHSQTSNFEPSGSFDLGTIQVPIQEEKDSLDRFGGRKWLLAMYIETIASIFTFMGILPVDQWLMVTGTVGSLYFGVNFMQKKML